MTRFESLQRKFSVKTLVDITGFEIDIGIQ